MKSKSTFVTCALIMFGFSGASFAARGKSPNFPTDLFSGPVEILSEDDLEAQGPDAPTLFAWQVRVNGCEIYSVEVPVSCTLEDDGPYGSWYCDAIPGKQAAVSLIRKDC